MISLDRADSGSIRGNIGYRYKGAALTIMVGPLWLTIYFARRAGIDADLTHELQTLEDAEEVLERIRGVQ